MEDMRTEVVAKDRFELLFEILRIYYDKFLETSFKVAGLLFLVGGWVLASDKTWVFLSADPIVATTTMAALVLAWAMFTATCYRAYRLSNEVFGILTTLNYIEREYYSRYKIAFFMFGMVVAANGLLTSWLLLIVWRSSIAPAPAA
jgi:hypothetical protein